jgi:hypothetical protein
MERSHLDDDIHPELRMQNGGLLTVTRRGLAN